LSRFTSYLAAPMIAGDTVSGFLALAREPGRAAFGDGDIALVAPLAAHTGTGIVNAATLARHLAIANVLQRGLLAVDPPRPARLEVAGRCVPAAGNLIGGDWYDVIPLPGERTGLIVGDVMGHGPEAAAAMAQLRTAAHALAQLDLEPCEVLTQLDRTILTLRGVPLATCVYAVIDPDSESCVLATAGHLPPVLARPDGVTRILDMPTGQSLGIGPAIYGQARIKLKPDAILALFTDGLVETRTRSFDHGVSAFRSELGRGGDPLEARCDALLHALAHDQEDDVTLILARIPRKAQ
jgi:serine phosphatase RsbU (regulator of sigma subunit)